MTQPATPEPTIRQVCGQCGEPWPCPPSRDLEENAGPIARMLLGDTHQPAAEPEPIRCTHQAVEPNSFYAGFICASYGCGALWHNRDDWASRVEPYGHAPLIHHPNQPDTTRATTANTSVSDRTSIEAAIVAVLYGGDRGSPTPIDAAREIVDQVFIPELVKLGKRVGVRDAEVRQLREQNDEWERLVDGADKVAVAYAVAQADLRHLRERLDAAELVCAIFGMGAQPPGDGERYLALRQAFEDWADICPVPRNVDEVPPEHLASLAERWQATVAARRTARGGRS